MRYMSEFEKEARNWQARAKRYIARFQGLGDARVYTYRGQLWVEAKVPGYGSPTVGHQTFTCYAWNREDVLDRLGEWKPEVPGCFRFDFCAHAWDYEVLRLLAQVQ